ncbi:MAG: hypothetical protein HN509_18625 [Halobacteriovoraceae bacterium]|jgi:hypothetical protein|nr:hypothetical protein [Halobacteriovoraceae bacterium]
MMKVRKWMLLSLFALLPLMMLMAVQSEKDQELSSGSYNYRPIIQRALAVVLEKTDNMAQYTALEKNL